MVIPARDDDDPLILTNLPPGRVDQTMLTNPLVSPTPHPM